MSDKQQQLFKTRIVPGKAGSGNLFEEEFVTGDRPVECLGMTFENDEKRRGYFLEELREKFKDPEFRKIEGFPIGEDEDILALSDPPYYTACPNPWIADFVTEWEAQKPAQPEGSRYHREPFAVDVSEGKTHPIYKAHSYHTKVPHLAIVPSILHYTEPGDIVLDGFNGSGMTGIAAQWCGSPPQDYRVELEQKWKAEGYDAPKWGLRHCVLNDLSPAATFMAANYNLPFDVRAFSIAAKKLLEEVEKEIGWMYETLHTDGETKGRVEYTVWSEVFICPDCSGEVVFLDEALDKKSKRVKERFPCPHCGAEISKRRLEKNYTTEFDNISGETRQVPKRTPSIICYKVGKNRIEKKPDQADLDILRKISQMELPEEFPKIALPYMHMTHERARMDRSGVTHIHHFFFPRAALALGVVWRKAKAYPDARIRHMLMFMIDQSIWGLSILNRYQPIMHGRPGGSQVNRQMTGVYYVASQTSECSPWYNLGGKVNRLPKAFESQYAKSSAVVTGTGSTTSLQISDQSIDYIFTDPPFGENIYYADLNFMVESWYDVLSNATAEATVDKAKKKGLPEYQELMRRCFTEYYRVLKPGHWITIVFHNSRNSVWNAIQEALQNVGFDVLQLQLFVSDEASAIQWLKQQLTKKPQTFQDIHPQFLKKIAGWQKHEKALELSELLEQNFLCYDGKSEVPSQIHSYLSSNFKELRNLEKDDSALKAKAKDRWYAPDPNKAGDLEKLREKALLKEFQGYTERTKKFKRNEKFRMEAVRAGFKKAWQERDYATIITVARKIPDKILQEDPKLLMWYDQAVTRTGKEG